MEVEVCLMEVKCIFLDVDGTLIEPIKGIFRIRSEHETLFQSLQKRNIKIVCATGRPLYALGILTSFKFDAYICLNGAMVYFNNELIQKTSYSKADIKRLWDTLVKLKIDFVMQGDESLFYLDKNSPYVKQYLDHVLNRKNTQAHCKFPDCDIYKTTVFLTDEKQKEDLMQRVGANNNVMFYSSHLRDDHALRLNGEITQKGVNKGRGVNTILNVLNINENEAIAFGDNDNDIEMFEKVKGFAMGNATKELKKVAFKVIDDVSTLTIIDEINKLI